MNPRSLEACRETLRLAVSALTKENGGQNTSQHLRAWLALYQITEKKRWLDLLRGASSAASLDSLSPEERGEWLRLCCDCWVIDAAGPFRAAANKLAADKLSGTRAIPGLLRNWRITGETRFRDQALAQLPAKAAESGFDEAAAFHAAYHATGDEQHLEAARAPFTDCSPTDVPLRWWPLAWDILHWDAQQVAETVASWQDGMHPAHDIVPALAPICLPPVDLEVRWWDARELEEGYVAEAVTFPYPALRLQFVRRTSPGQVVFASRLDGEPREILEDAGIIASLLSNLIDEVNRQAVVNPPRTRLGKGTIRHR